MGLRFLYLPRTNIPGTVLPHGALGLCAESEKPTKSVGGDGERGAGSHGVEPPRAVGPEEARPSPPDQGRRHRGHGGPARLFAEPGFPSH